MILYQMSGTIETDGDVKKKKDWRARRVAFHPAVVNKSKLKGVP